MSTTLIEELWIGTAALTYVADLQRASGHLTGIGSAEEWDARAARLRQRAAWVRELEARWKRDRYQYGPPPSFREEADKRLGTLLVITGPDIPAAAPSPETGTAAVPPEPTVAEKQWPHAYECPLRCRQCGGEAEEARRVYATPVCYKCLPPPAPLPVVVIPDEYPPVRLVQIRICQACLDGIGSECHTPGCALWLHSVDIPIHRELYEIIEDATDPAPAPEPVKPATWDRCVKHADEMHAMHEYDPGTAARWASQNNIGRCTDSIPARTPASGTAPTCSCHLVEGGSDSWCPVHGNDGTARAPTAPRECTVRGCGRHIGDCPHGTRP